jgi:hypothetical protein
MELIVPRLVLLGSLWFGGALSGAWSQMPEFGQDTVLVWKAYNQVREESTFVVRIAQFRPDRYFEWENSTTQGTIFLAAKAVMDARAFLNLRLFVSGVDTKSKDATTLWLSERAFRDLKSKGKVKLAIDSLDEWVILKEGGELSVEVNRVLRTLPVIKVSSERGTERWFLDSADNPLQVKLLVRQYEETLTSITTDRPNALRWIKGKKLTQPH